MEDLSKYWKKKIIPLLKAIFPTAILTFISYAFLAQFIGAAKLDGYFSQFTANRLASIVSTVFYALWFHWFYTTTTNKIYVLHVKTDAPFRFLEEGKAFFKEQNGTTMTPCAKKKAPFLRKKAKTGLFL